MFEKEMDRTDSADTLASALDTIIRMTLRQDIMQAVEPYRTNLRRPPFTMGELIIMAIVVKERRLESEWCTTEEEIMAWIGETFVSYAREMMNHSIRSWSGHIGYEYQDTIVGPPIDGFYTALHSHDLPLEGCTRRYFDTAAYNVAPHKARCYLSRWLLPTIGQAFRFMDLPPELRNRVYTKLFHFPGAALEMYCSASGYGDDESNNERRLKITELEYDTPDGLDFTNSRNRWSSVHPEEISKLLSILVTCKQIYTEAKAIFYSNNIFRFDSIATLSHTLRYRLHSNRAQFLRHIRIEMAVLRNKEKEFMEDAFWRLASIPLDSLTLIERWCAAPFDSRSEMHCVQGGKHDQKLAKLGSKLDALVLTCRNVKHIEFVPERWEEQSSGEETCDALKRFVMGRLKQEGKEKMKCCSMMPSPREREEVVD